MVDENIENQQENYQEIILPVVRISENSLRELATFIAEAVAKETHMASVAKQYLDELYSEIGSPDEAATTIISYIQRRHGWDVELLAEKREVEEMLFKRFSRYDEDIWEKIMNTDAISDLHHEVYKLSQKYIAFAIDEVLNEEDIEEDGSNFDGGTHPELD